jgi:glucosamine--fructose-6-phosphate aminotransferase (isomerizing)
MAGHLFGYHAARAIDTSAPPLRAARAMVAQVMAEQDNHALHRMRPALVQVLEPFHTGLNSGIYNGNLKPATAVRLSLLLHSAAGLLPIEAYERGDTATPVDVLSDLLATLNTAIGELTRPIDAVKHQAKTVTVGISRSEEALLSAPLVKAVLTAGVAPDALGFRTLRTLSALDEAVAETLGYTRYRISRDMAGVPTVAVVEQAGSVKDLCSRTNRDPRLRGTKHQAAAEREVTVAVGMSDGRTIIVVPEVKGIRAVGITLVHVRFHDALSSEAAKRVLRSYKNRYAEFVDASSEPEEFDDAHLAREPTVDLLTQPIPALAQRWRIQPRPLVMSPV